MPRTRRPIREQHPLTQAALAAITGTLKDDHRSALVVCCERDGRTAIAAKLGELTARAGPDARWWDRQLQLLADDLTASRSLEVMNELQKLESEGAGPPADPDRRALGVSAAVRYLQTHLQHVLRGDASKAEVARVAAIVREVRRLVG